MGITSIICTKPHHHHPFGFNCIDPFNIFSPNLSTQVKGVTQRVHSPDQSRNDPLEDDVQAFLIDEDQLHTFDDLTKVNPVTPATGTKCKMSKCSSRIQNFVLGMSFRLMLNIKHSPSASAKMPAGQVQFEGVLHPRRLHLGGSQPFPGHTRPVLCGCDEGVSLRYSASGIHVIAAKAPCRHRPVGSYLNMDFPGSF